MPPSNLDESTSSPFESIKITSESNKSTIEQEEAFTRVTYLILREANNKLLSISEVIIVNFFPINPLSFKNFISSFVLLL